MAIDNRARAYARASSNNPCSNGPQADERFHALYERCLRKGENAEL